MNNLISTIFLTLSLAVLATGVQADQVKIVTNVGEIVIDLDEKKAPITVANFLRYVDEGAYNETIFHRVIPGFMVQGGGHHIDMSEAPDTGTIVNEAENGLRNDPGTIAMARMSEIDSASRQFFINVAKNDFLNHRKDSCTREQEAATAAARARGSVRPPTCKSYGYAVFGKVVSGMDVVDLIEVTETHSVGQYDDVPVSPVIILSVERLVPDAES